MKGELNEPLGEPDEHTLDWIRAGVFAGLATCAVYPALIFLPLPDAAAALLASAWGPLLGVASLGLGRFLRLERRSLSAQLGALFNVIAGALVTAMLLVQIAVGMRAADKKVPTEVVAVWLGLDVAWDVYLGLGTGLFAWAMMRHPRFRKGFGVSGLVIAAGLLALNLYTFPEPPRDAGLFDMGPLVGLWYLAVTVQIWRSLAWARDSRRSKRGSDNR